MKRAFLILALCFATQNLFAQSNAEIANRFFDAYQRMDFKEMASYWDQSVVLKDAIASELYGIDEEYTGREKLLRTWEQIFTPRPNYMNISVREQFESGSFVVTYLSLESSLNRQGKVIINMGEMFTIFKFKDGKIIDQYDFADYKTWDRQTNSVLKNEHKSTSVTDEMKTTRSYYEAYSDADFQAMGTFYADNVEFKDLTAKDAFSSDNFEQNGKEAVTNFWKGVLQQSSSNQVSVKINGMFQTGPYVMLNTTFSMVLPPSWVQGKEGVFVSFPIKTVLQIKEGKIMKHLDFADYNTYNAQIGLQAN